MTTLYVHGVSASDVYRRSPMPAPNPNESNQTSKLGIQVEDVEGWISEAAGILNTAASSVGLTPDDLTPDQEQIVRSGITSYALARLLEAKGTFSEEKIARHDKSYRRVLDTIRSMPSQVGPTQGQFQSNIPVNDKDREDAQGRGQPDYKVGPDSHF